MRLKKQINPPQKNYIFLDGFFGVSHLGQGSDFKKKHFCPKKLNREMGVLLFKVLLFDILLPIVDKIFDGLTIYHFINNGDIWWAVGTIGIIMMPGFLELFAWTYSYCRGDTSTKACSLWIIFFGPILYPISTIVW